MLVRSRMTDDVITTAPGDTLARALELTRTHRIRHLPVVEDGRLVGIVSAQDLRFAHPPIWLEDADSMRRALYEHTVAEIMTREVVTIAPDAPVEEAARLLHTRSFGCLPVVEGEELVGIITESDILRAIAELMGTGTTSRLEVLMPNRPGELARVIRLIGIEMRINIAGMFAPVAEEGHCHAVLHLQTPDAAPVVQALRQLGYVSGSPSIEQDDVQPRTTPRRIRSALQL